ncbi:CBS domain-containing protein [Candidatus Nitrosocosmicus sp. T]
MDILNKDVKTAEQNQNIFEISKIMFDNKIGSVVVIDSNESKNPVGIITEKDIIRILSSTQLVNMQVPIKELMSHPIITLSSRSSVLDAMKLMYERKIRRIIVLEGNSFVGIVTEHDLFNTLMKNKNLITTVMDSNFPIPQKDMYQEFSHHWFSNSFFK